MEKLMQENVELLTNEEIDYLEKYNKINGLFLKVETIESDIDLIEDDEELEKLKNECYEATSELKSELSNWDKRCDLISEEVNSKIITKEDKCDLESFYRSRNLSLIGKRL